MFTVLTVFTVFTLLFIGHYIIFSLYLVYLSTHPQSVSVLLIRLPDTVSCLEQQQDSKGTIFHSYHYLHQPAMKGEKSLLESTLLENVYT